MRWLTNINEVSNATDQELRRSLITCDGAGRQLKEAALNELLNRQTKKEIPQEWYPDTE